jgi:hypothetical protein
MPAPGVLTADLDDELVLLAPISGIYYGLDEVGRAIWKQIEEMRPIATVRDRVLEQYDVEPERLEADLDEFLRDLADEGLIVLIDRPPR